MGALGIKIVTVYPENPSRHGKPTVMGVIVLNDPETGEVSAIMDGGYITAMRTGAAERRRDEVHGQTRRQGGGHPRAGVRRGPQLEAIALARRLERGGRLRRGAGAEPPIRRGDERAAGHRGRCRRRGPGGVEGSDIVAAATSSSTPIFDGRWVEPGTHINGIGSHAPHMRELDTAVVARSRVIVDLRSAPWPRLAT